MRHRRHDLEYFTQVLGNKYSQKYSSLEHLGMASIRHSIFQYQGHTISYTERRTHILSTEGITFQNNVRSSSIFEYTLPDPPLEPPLDSPHMAPIFLANTVPSVEKRQPSSHSLIPLHLHTVERTVCTVCTPEDRFMSPIGSSSSHS